MPTRCRSARRGGARLAVGASTGALALALAACPPPVEPPVRPEGNVVEVGVAADAAVATVDERFLSFAVDSSQVVGGDFWDPVGGYEAPVDPYDFHREKLRGLASQLAPAFLRIGGTEADELYADLSDDPVSEAPAPFVHVLEARMLDDVCDFATDLGLDVFWTLNAGPGTRDADNAWTEDEARKVITYLRDAGCPVEIWELGNEINGFGVIHGFEVSGAEYAADMAKARALVDELTPNVDLAGPASAFWPVIGEFSPVLPSFLEAGGHLVDLVTWHYYPQQSSRCPLAVRPAAPGNLLEPANLDEVDVWAEHVESRAAEHAPDARVVLGETGHAQCGGEIGYSGTFLSLFWWLDQLGRIAHRGQPLSVRQTLSGADYQLIDELTLEPTPDYWGSLLHKRLMGQTVLDVTVAGEPSLRAYAHCGKEPGAVVVLLLNLDPDVEHIASLDGLGAIRDAFVLDAPELQGREVHLNGTPLVAPDDGLVGELVGERLDATGAEHPPWLVLPPTSAAFAVFPEAGAPACL